MLRGMDNDYHHLQTRKLKFGDEVPCLWVYRHTHACVAEILEARQFWCQSPTPTRAASTTPPGQVPFYLPTCLYPLSPLEFLKRSDSSQLSVWHCARVKRSPHWTKSRPSPTTWTAQESSTLLSGRWDERTSHPPWSREDDISRQSCL